MRIPFNIPPIVGREIDYLRRVIEAGHLHGDGPFTKQCKALLESRYGTTAALLTHSGTGSLEMAAILCDIQPGDEFIVPSYTFVSTVNAFVLRGGVPVWCDIRPDTLNMDETLIEGLITDRTRAIVPVHYGGVACEMDTIMRIATDRGLRVVEDAAQGIEASYKGRPLGAIGDLGCFSFHGTKNVVAGEGGALFVNDHDLTERAEIVREKGTNRSQFIRGEVDKYTWVDIGSSFLPSELTAAFLLAQLEQAEEITARRLAVWDAYYEALEPLADAGKLTLPTVPEGCRHNAHMFYVLLSSQEERDKVMDGLKRQGVSAVFHYVPLHSSPAGRQRSAEVSLPVTDDLWCRLLRLPMYADLSTKDVDRIVQVLSQVV